MTSSTYAHPRSDFEQAAGGTRTLLSEMQDFKLPAGPWIPELVAKVICGVKDGKEHSASLITLFH